MSQVDLSRAVGHQGSELPVSWTTRDLLLYVIGIGGNEKDLQFVYELDPAFEAFPTFPLVLGFKGTSSDVVNFEESRGAPTPGLPKLDSKKLVHAEQALQILKPLPRVSGQGWKIRRVCTGVHDKGKNLIVEQTSILEDPNGVEYAKMIASSFHFGAGGHGGFSKSISPKLSVTASKNPPNQPPTHTVSYETAPTQAIVYRLSGDYNPLHIDPKIGPGMGFKGAILHGLSSFGIASMAIVKAVAEGRGSRLKEIGCRFTKPVYPGGTSYYLTSALSICIDKLAFEPPDTLETLIWTQDRPDGIAVT